MMSSSDKQIIATQVAAKWEPLVPDQLETHEAATGDIEDRKDLELEKAFKELYKQEQLTQKKFSLLYGPAEEDESLEKEDEPDQDDIEADISMEVSPEDVVPETPDIETIKREAYEEGFAKGQTEGYEAGVLMAGEKTERLNLILNNVESLWKNLLKNSEEKIIELIAKISEKVVYGHVSVDNTIITRAILDIFEKIPDPVDATITVNPDDYEYIEVVKDDFFEEIKGLKQVSIVSDPLMEPGGCRIETSSGEVDTSIEERLEAVKRSVINVSESLKV